MNKNILKYLALLATTLHLNAEEIYTIDALLLKSLKNSPDIYISKANYEASKSRYDAAFSGYLPSVDLSISAGEVGQNDITTASKEMIHDTLLLGKLSLNQLLYDFGKTAANVEKQSYNSDTFSMQTLQDISDKKRALKSAYYSVLSAQELIAVQKENLSLNEAQLYRAQKYFQAGIRTKIDISDARVSLIQAQINLKKAQYNLKLAYATLDKIVGFSELEQEYRLYSQKLNLSSLYSSLHHYDLNLKEAILYAYENRAILKKYKAQILSSSAALKERTSEYYPSLYFDADYTKQSLEKFKALAPENKWQTTLNLKWNLYQGGATDAATQESEIGINISNASLQELKLTIKKETTQAYINLNKIEDSLELSQSLLEVSSEKFHQASKRYEYGLSDYIELQEAREGYIDAKASLVVNYYEYYAAIATLDNAIGR